MTIPVLHKEREHLGNVVQEKDMIELISKGRAIERPLGHTQDRCYEVNGHYYIKREKGYYQRLE